MRSGTRQEVAAGRNKYQVKREGGAERMPGAADCRNQCKEMRDEAKHVECAQ